MNTNYLALVSQNNLNKSQSALGSAIERLSSGLRINSAKDDAAGQAIANRFTANIKGLTQAARNSNDGISIAQTTEGALNEMNNNLQRIRELSVQAANGTNSASDLKSIQDEIGQRLSEINRVSEQTQFNSVRVLASNSKLAIQVGANDNETIEIDLKQIDSKTLGLDTFNVTGPQGTLSALVASDYEAAFGATTQVGASAVTEATPDTLSTRLGLAAGGATIAAAPVKDANGNWFAEVSITSTSAQETINLANNGFNVANGATEKFYLALDPKNA
ncbi:flagellin FliC, partial [Castellaniella sp.]|uniref:flagellin N-terminal helical domain-containing protein n=1 Tax=Castellaniella sp. TaxID=1955812 RepID=UPI003C781414